MPCNVVVAPDIAGLSRAAVQHVAKISTESIASRGRFVVALSGGSMPGFLQPLFDVIPPDAWLKWHVFFADERCVDLDHNDSNFKACSDFLARVPAAQVHPLPVASGVGLDDPAGLAGAYESELQAACEANGAFDKENYYYEVMMLPGTRLVLMILCCLSADYLLQQGATCQSLIWFYWAWAQTATLRLYFLATHFWSILALLLLTWWIHQSRHRAASR